jgi:hypothetical protein
MPKTFTTLIAKFICVLAIVLAGFYVLWNPYWADGDEPHYLVMVESFIQDRDFDLKNNYDSKQYYAYRPTDLEDGHILISPKDGSHRTWHNILLPIMVSPGYVMRGILGARLVLFMLNLLGVFVLFKILRQVCKFSPEISYLSIALFVFNLPVINHTHIIFPDLLSGNFLLLGSYFLWRSIKSKKYTNWWLVFASSVFGLAMFVHLKLVLGGALFIFIYLILELWSYLKSEKILNRISKTESWVSKLKLFLNSKIKFLKTNWGKFLAVCTPFCLFIFIYSYTMYRWWGSWALDAPFAQIFDDSPSYANPFYGFLGTLFDGNYGFLAHAPLFVLTVPGMFIWYKQDRQSFLRMAIPAIILLVFQSSFVVWRTWGPSARYLMFVWPTLFIGFVYMFRFLLQSLWGKFILVLLILTNLIFVRGVLFTRTAGFPLPEGKDNIIFENYILQRFPSLDFLRVVFLDLYNENILHYIIAFAIFTFLVIWGIVVSSTKVSFRNT